jgi:thiol-disulfide isomerase/thioredoxin
VTAKRRTWVTVAAVWVGGALLIGLAVAHFTGGASASPAADAGDPVGHVVAVAPDKRVPAAALSGALLGGGTFDPAAYAGHVVVVNAWGSWCTPCRAELPVLRKLATATYPATVDFVGIDIGEKSMADGAAMAKKYALPYPSIYDEDKTAYTALAPQMAYAVPGTVIIDANGRVAATVIGQVNEAELSAYLRKLAGEAS